MRRSASPCPLRLHREGAFSWEPQEKRTRIALQNMGTATIDAVTVARFKIGCIMFFVDGMKPEGRKQKEP